MHAEEIRGLTQIAVGLQQHACNEFLFELPLRVLVAHTAIDHFLDETLQLLFELRHY